MFKEKDNMRPGPTPERVLAICRLLEKESYTSSELHQLCELDMAASTSEDIRRSIEAAEELNLIRRQGNRYILHVDGEKLSSAGQFRKTVAPLIFSDKNSTFFKLTEWFISNADQVFLLNRFDDFAAVASKSGVDGITENDVLGWRFWMRYLGHAYQYNKTLIPNMKVRMEDAMSGLKKGSRMTCVQFVAWIKENIPEAASACSNGELPLAISNGLRTLQSEGRIELVSTRDAIRISLYPLRGVETNEFSDIVIREIG